jgi:hypothetical protein
MTCSAAVPAHSRDHGINPALLHSVSRPGRCAESTESGDRLSPVQFCLMSPPPRGKVHMATDIAH